MQTSTKKPEFKILLAKKEYKSTNSDFSSSATTKSGYTLETLPVDLNIEEGRWMTEKIHLSPTKTLAGARMHVKHDTFFQAVIFMG